MKPRTRQEVDQESTISTVQAIKKELSSYLLQTQKQKIQSSSALFCLLPYLEFLQVVRMQQVSRSFYTKFVPLSLKRMQAINTTKAGKCPLEQCDLHSLFVVWDTKTSENKLRLFTHLTKEWSIVHLTEDVGGLLERPVKFQNTMWPKVVRAPYSRREEYFVMGGLFQNDVPQVNLNINTHSSREVWRVNIVTQKAFQCQQMPAGLFAFGLVAHRHEVFVVGGLRSNVTLDVGAQLQAHRGCYRYDTLNNHWYTLPELTEGRISPVLYRTGSRLYAVMGLRNSASSVAKVSVLDFSSLSQGWQDVISQGEKQLPQSLTNIGLIKATDKQGQTDLVLFGGNSMAEFSPEESSSTIELSLFHADNRYSVKKIEDKQGSPDRFIYQQAWQLPNDFHTFQIIGAKFLHSFGPSNKPEQTEAMGYRLL